MGRYNCLIAISIFLFSFIVQGCASTANITNIHSPDFYEGDGGKNIKIAVLSPNFNNASKNDTWIPLFIQGTLATNFNIFSAITVLDRQNLEAILSEQRLAANGNFSDDDYIKIGNLTNAKFIVIGTLLNIQNSGISLQLAITDTESGERKASFVKNCTIEDIQNVSVLNEATILLLSQLGVNLTVLGKNTLLKSRIATNNAEEALAKGIIAQKNGTVVEAMSYYHDATSYDPKLNEAVSRLSQLTVNISSGNIGSDARNAIAQRKEWVSITAECDQYFKNHLPYRILYGQRLTQGNLNYNTETLDLTFNLNCEPTSQFQVVNNILEGLNRTGHKSEWGLGQWPFSSEYLNNIEIKIDFSLVNEKNETIGSTSILVKNKIEYEKMKIFVKESFPENSSAASGFFTLGALTSIVGVPGCAIYLPLYLTTPSEQKGDKEAFGGLAIASGTILGISIFSFGLSRLIHYLSKPESKYIKYILNENSIGSSNSFHSVTFQKINANKITDKLTIRVDKINGIPAEKAVQSNYIKEIISGN
jgi:hypothetical protein